MKEESVLNVLMYLFKNHMQDNCELDTIQTKLFLKLERLGFRSKAIKQAFIWLDNLSKASHQPIQLASKNALRVFSDYERSLLDTQCRSFLISLEQQGILNPQTRELVINKVLELELDSIDVGLIKWVTLMVLFNQPNEKHALACMEFLVLDETIGGVQ